MSSARLAGMNLQNIIGFIEFSREQAIYFAQNDEYFSSKLQTYEFTKSPYPDDVERQSYEEVINTNERYSFQNIVNENFIVNGRRNQLVDRMIIDIIHKSVSNGVYDNTIQDGLSDYANFILYVDDYMCQQGNPSVFKDTMINALVDRASILIKHHDSGIQTTSTSHCDIYEMMPDEINCVGVDPISCQKITTCFRLDADNRRICYDISTIVAVVNSAFGLNTPVSPFTREPFSENDMKRIKGFIKLMATSRPVTRAMSGRK